MNKSRWVMTDAGWRHRPWWKVAINSALRFVQRGRKHQWLIATKAKVYASPDRHPDVEGYSFELIEVSNAS